MFFNLKQIHNYLLLGGPVYSVAWSADNDSVLYATGKTLTIKPLSVNAKANSVKNIEEIKDIM